MAYDEELADRIRTLTASEFLAEKRMFGGLAFLLNGNLAVAASSTGGLMVRVDPDDTDALVARPHVERMVMSGRELDGWLRVAQDALVSDDDLRGWVDRGLAFASTLPAK